jgi:DNA mismatch repair ATPase MutL
MIKESPVVLGQLKETYILCETKEGLLLVDQHAAHERRVYEKLKKSYDNSSLECQPFLIPQSRVSPGEQNDFKKMGNSELGITSTLRRDFTVRSVRTSWSTPLESFLRELIPLRKNKAVKGDRGRQACPQPATELSRRAAVSQQEMARSWSNWMKWRCHELSHGGPVRG